MGKLIIKENEKNKNGGKFYNIYYSDETNTGQMRLSFLNMIGFKLIGGIILKRDQVIDGIEFMSETQQVVNNDQLDVLEDLHSKIGEEISRVRRK